MDPIAEWMTSPAGRWAQIGAGASLIALSLGLRRPGLAVAGLLPLAAGVFDLLLISPLLAMPTTGRKVRREVGVLQDVTLVPAESHPEGIAAIT
ncbi:MAG TPA: hypothetical protein VH083_18720 [Myxococcales bacterium]|jgi:hypothetical protein|nr:hypothetical protein [Myxococcales bacterium]